MSGGRDTSSGTTSDDAGCVDARFSALERLLDLHHVSPTELAVAVEEHRRVVRQVITSAGPGRVTVTNESGCAVHLLTDSGLRQYGAPPRGSALGPFALLPYEVVAPAIASAHAASKNVASIRFEVVRERRHRLVLNSRSVRNLVESDRLDVHVYARARRGGRAFTAKRTFSSIHAPDDELAPRLTALASEATLAAERFLEARPVPRGLTDVVLGTGRSGIFLHEVIGHCLEGDTMLTGQSVFSSSLGRRIATDEWTIVDEPLPSDGPRPSQHDDEGERAKRIVLVDRGVLRRMLLDQYTARRFGLKRSHNGRRATCHDPSLPRMSNTLLLSGTTSPQDILGGVRRGVYVDRLVAAAVEQSSGQFTLVTREAYLVEGGKITAPLEALTITGNGPHQLQRTGCVGTDTSQAPGAWSCEKRGQSVPVGFGGPTLRLFDVVVGGTA